MKDETDSFTDCLNIWLLFLIFCIFVIIPISIAGWSGLLIILFPVGLLVLILGPPVLCAYIKDKRKK